MPETQGETMPPHVRRSPWSRASLGLAATLAALALSPGSAAAQALMSRALPDLDGRLVYQPGQSAEPHRHPAHLVAYVVSGRIESALDDQPPVLYGPGEFWYESPMQLHRTFRNPSATESVTVVVFGLRDPDAPGLIPEPGAQGR
jgi:hypothetical protein